MEMIWYITFEACHICIAYIDDSSCLVAENLLYSMVFFVLSWLIVALIEIDERHVYGLSMVRIICKKWFVAENLGGENLHGVVVNVLNCIIIVSKFKL